MLDMSPLEDHQILSVVVVSSALLAFEVIIEGVPAFVEHAVAIADPETSLKQHVRTFDAFMAPALFLALAAKALHSALTSGGIVPPLVLIMSSGVGVGLTIQAIALQRKQKRDQRSRAQKRLEFFVKIASTVVFIPVWLALTGMLVAVEHSTH